MKQCHLGQYATTLYNYLEGYNFVSVFVHCFFVLLVKYRVTTRTTTCTVSSH